MTPEQFVVEFIGPNMTWLSEYEDLLRTGSLGSDWLRETVAKRLQWEALAEFGYLARRGRSLETVGSAALGIEPERVAAAIARIGPELREGLGLRDLAEDRLRVFVWGFLLYLKRRGAIAHEFWLTGKMPVVNSVVSITAVFYRERLRMQAKKL